MTKRYAIFGYPSTTALNDPLGEELLASADTRDEAQLKAQEVIAVHGCRRVRIFDADGDVNVLGLFSESIRDLNDGPRDNNPVFANWGMGWDTPPT
jgi:hypothetical protein